jgi:hypothetical protein
MVVMFHKRDLPKNLLPFVALKRIIEIENSDCVKGSNVRIHPRSRRCESD